MNIEEIPARLNHQQLVIIVRFYISVSIAALAFFVAFMVFGIVMHRTTVVIISAIATVASIFYLIWMIENYRRLQRVQ